MTYWIHAASKVKLEWRNGQPSMDVCGEIVYNYQVEFSNESTMTAKYLELEVLWDYDIATPSVEHRLRPILGDKDKKSAGKAFIVPHNSSFAI
ncbi:hypothetical protein F66182_10727 [Fusarium sp. NRRL 66182]|nr:hypothetical protein F66182_10727 [Fusarium sp. NRRL 66182]